MKKKEGGEAECMKVADIKSGKSTYTDYLTKEAVIYFLLLSFASSPFKVKFVIYCKKLKSVAELF